MRASDASHQSCGSEGSHQMLQVFLGDLLLFGHLLEGDRSSAVVERQAEHRSYPVSRFRLESHHLSALDYSHRISMKYNTKNISNNLLPFDFGVECKERLFIDLLNSY